VTAVTGRGRSDGVSVDDEMAAEAHRGGRTVARPHRAHPGA
jgi:hypothetical protein